MPLTKKMIDEALGSLVKRKNGYYYIRDKKVDAAIQRITGSFVGCYAYVKDVGTVGKKLVIGNAVARLGKPLVEIYIRDDI